MKSWVRQCVICRQMRLIYPLNGRLNDAEENKNSDDDVMRPHCATSAQDKLIVTHHTPANIHNELQWLCAVVEQKTDFIGCWRQRFDRNLTNSRSAHRLVRSDNVAKST